MGDGMVISFDLASDAVRCTIEIQKSYRADDSPLKIGIHEGEMVFEGTDVLGDAANIAYEQRDYLLCSLQVFPDWEKFRDYMQFDALLLRMNFSKND